MIDFSKSKNWNSWEDWTQTKMAYYGSKTRLQVYGGIIDFDPDNKKDLVGGEKITYDEYLDLQMMACENKGKVRWHFAMCYYYTPLEFAGEIERITGKAVCFKRIYVSGMYPDGSCFEGKEEHVWIEKQGLEDFGVGDSLSFFAEPYRYIKTRNGKQIDFGLRNPQGVRRIYKYKLPSDKQLMVQSIDAIICETCYLNEQCYGGCCLRNKNELQALRKEMLKAVMGTEKERRNTNE